MRRAVQEAAQEGSSGDCGTPVEKGYWIQQNSDSRGLTEILRCLPIYDIIQVTRPAFFEKVQLQFQLANLLVEFVLLVAGLLPQAVVAVAEDLRQSGKRLLLPAANQSRVDVEHLCDPGRGLVPLDDLDSDLGLREERTD